MKGITMLVDKTRGEQKFVSYSWNADTAHVRNDTMEGREYTVVPMVMLTEGVHAGSGGALFYPFSEISKTPQVWNHKPVVVYHPDGPTACDPDILTNRKIGVIMNTKAAKGKLKAEAWLENDRVEKVDNRIAEAIESGTMMELSTGLYCDPDGVPGEWHGEEYEATVYNYRPDHLAILPDKKGACSIEDGAGFLRLNESQDNGGVTEVFRRDIVPLLNRCGIDTDKLVALELSQSDQRLRISKLLPKETWIEEVYDDRVIYSDIDGRLFQVGYKMDRKDKVSLVGVPVEVERKISYVAIKNMKGCAMDKDKMVEALIGNDRTQWTEDDRETLNAMDPDVLAKLEPVEIQKNELQEAAEQGAAELKPPVENKETEKVENEEPKEMTAQEYINNAPPQVRDMLQAGMDEHNSKKASVVEKILSNEQNQFSKEDLESKDLKELTAIAALLPKPAQTPMANNYIGLGEASTNNTEEVLPLPSMSFGE